jgi:putative ABC transport system permease protein
MNFREAFVIAVRSLRLNKLRSGLTTVGIVIGVVAVIVLVGFGQGLKSGFNKSFGALATAVTVQKVDGSVPGAGPARDLTDADVAALRRESVAPDIASVVPVVTGQGVAQHGPGQQDSVQITGSTVDYLSVNNRGLALGSMFGEVQYRGNAKVVVLGPDTVNDLYGGDSAAALGSTVRIGRTPLKVIGVLQSDGHDDDVALMPLGTARSYLLGGADKITSISVKAASVAQVPAGVAEINRVMFERHDIRDPSKRDFQVIALQDQLDQVNQFLSYLTLFVVAVAGVSLLVGAIGVANIMLVSVTERTLEIGIRKAIGARRSVIMKQFLIESMALAGLGGVMGIGLGVGIVLIGVRVMPTVAPNFGAPQVSIPAIAAAFLVSVVIGLFAGGYPAFRASRLQPIEALRFQ